MEKNKVWTGDLSNCMAQLEFLGIEFEERAESSIV